MSVRMDVLVLAVRQVWNCEGVTHLVAPVFVTVFQKRLTLHLHCLSLVTMYLSCYTQWQKVFLHTQRNIMVWVHRSQRHLIKLRVWRAKQHSRPETTRLHTVSCVLPFLYAIFVEIYSSSFVAPLNFFHANVKDCLEKLKSHIPVSIRLSNFN